MLSFKALRTRLVWLLGLCAAAGIAANYKFNYGPRLSAASSPHGSEAPPHSATPQEKQPSPEAQTAPEKQPSLETQPAAVPAAVAAAAAAVTAAAAALVPCDGDGCGAALQDMRSANAQLHAALRGVGATDEKNYARESVGLRGGAVKAKVEVEEAPAPAAAEDVGVAAAAGREWSAAAAGKEWSVPPAQVEGPADTAGEARGGRSARLPTLIIYAAVRMYFYTLTVTLTLTLSHPQVDDGEEGSWDRRDNLRFFLRHALLDHSEYQFLIVINGCHRMDVAKYVMARNVHVLVRENVCFDAGAWLAGLDYMAEVQERVRIGVCSVYLPRQQRIAS
ncbi:hypothetical protein JKP88DRAFT_250913 [Tribonema minus]|uniref:Hexosyltransferase n=1 Tax=Tribonema minus TaxID=303371 RepID=A0A836CP03_9STRA|nr:hypothetical protein JKP88DRAFT_250913 [Tribonema minus]